NSLFAGASVACKVAVMRGLMRLRHEHADVVSDHLARSVSEQRLGRIAEGLDDPTNIDRDDRIGSRRYDRAQSRLALAERLLGLLPLRDVLSNRDQTERLRIRVN